MHIAQLFLVVCISVATAEFIIFDIDEPLQADVKCGDKVCKNFATCKGKTCLCLEGTTGGECEVVTGCAKLQAKCDKIGSDCFYDNYSREASCKCSDEKKKFNGDICADCECGEQVQSCIFTREGKYCFCKKGFADKFGTCSACSCGEFEERCDFYKDEKNCMCKAGYVEANGTCISCTCGPHTKSCGFETGSKYCLCDEGYKFKLGTCEVCDCGTNSTSCVYDDDGAKICLCKNGNSNRLGTCTDCDCGPDTICAFKSTGEKDCTCVGEACREPGTPWFKNPVVIVCIVALVAIVVLIPAFVAYRKLRR